MKLVQNVDEVVAYLRVGLQFLYGLQETMKMFSDYNQGLCRASNPWLSSICYANACIPSHVSSGCDAKEVLNDTHRFSLASEVQI
jgi:hypothetical protein